MTTLKEHIFRLIRAQGPITIAEYMRLALIHPEHGYYTHRLPLGAPTERGGDFVTAPEISQIFGEMIGIFFVQAWLDRGSQARVRFVELGPGRGTMMADMLRAARVNADCAQALMPTLVELSESLRVEQARTLSGFDVGWTQTLDAVPADAPLFLVANEFLDALPIRQFVKDERGWHERMVATRGNALVFALSPETVPVPFVPAPFREAPDGSTFELALTAQAVIAQVADRVCQSGGVALFIDYGRDMSALADTFQAVRGHRYADPLAEPGLADLTAHVDFGALVVAAREAGAEIQGPVAQGAFLTAMGAALRAQRLAAGAPGQAQQITAALKRLMAPEAMGELFRVMALRAPRSPALPGFSPR